MLTKHKSEALFEKAKKYIPGGVNSPVRAFKAVGCNPLFIKGAKGPYFYDEDGNTYIELINSWGPMILGHANPKIEESVYKTVKNSLSFGAPCVAEVEIAKMIVEMVPSIEKVRMVNSGTEATMSAVRLARGYTKRDKIIKMDGCYHGHSDSFLIAAGSGAATMGVPNSPGVTEGTAKDTLTVPFNDLEAIKQKIKQNPHEIAAIILEPVAGNMGCVPPKEGYLKAIRQLCDQNGILFIFDEVITGFRLAQGGAQELYGIKPDLTTLGKIIGGGMPIGAYGGKKEIMDLVSPEGAVYQAGTLSGNPIAMATGIAMLKQIKEEKNLYAQLNTMAQKIANGFKENIRKQGLPYTVNQLGSMITVFFTHEKVIDFKSAQTCDLGLFGRYFREMLEKGIYLAPSQFETLFISTAITQYLADKIIKANAESLKNIH